MTAFVLSDMAAPGYGHSTFWFWKEPFRKAELLQQQTGVPIISWPQERVTQVGQLIKQVSQDPMALTVPQQRKPQTEACLKVGLPYIYSGFNALQWKQFQEEDMKGKTVDQFQMILGGYYCVLVPEQVSRVDLLPQLKTGELAVVRFLPSEDLDRTKVLDVYFRNSDRVVVGYELHEPGPLKAPQITPSATPQVAPAVPAPVSTPTAAPVPTEGEALPAVPVPSTPAPIQGALSVPVYSGGAQ
jgi:hypothetical protein